MAVPPPTSLSGCPLERLEIHGGSTCNTYDAAHLESSLTATLEAQRSTAGNHNNLLLQSHLGLRRLLSIQLADLARSLGEETDIVKVDEPSRKICIRIRQTEQIMIFHFRNRQDFNSTISMLKRLGFRAKNGISLSAHTCAANQPPSPHGYGPRLSSFTPLQSGGLELSQSPFSFTSMLNSDVPLTQIQSPGTQYQPIHQSTTQDLSQQSSQQVVPLTAYAPRLNPPYQIYLSQQRNMYQPRLSSPLRNIVPISDLSQSPTPPISASQPISATDYTVMASLPSHRSISTPNSLSNSWQQPEKSNTSYPTSLNHQLEPSGSQDSNTSAESSSQTMDEADDAFTLQLKQDFRKLMPRTRSLPFLKEKRNHKVVKPKPTHKQSKRHNSPHVEHENKEALFDHSDVSIKEKTKTSKTGIVDSIVDSNADPNVDSIAGSIADSSAGAQLVLHSKSPKPTISQAETTSPCRSSFEVAELSTMLIANPTLLERVNQSTSKLLDQYTADISRGCDGAAYAEFYLKQIHIVRRDFWLDQLK